MESEDEIYSEFCYLSSSDSDDDSAFSYADLLSAIAEIGGLYQLSASSTYRVQHLKLPSISQKSTPCKFWMMGKCKRGDYCTFSHDSKFLPSNNVKHTNTVPSCECLKGDLCNFSHDLNDRNSIENFPQVDKQDYQCCICLEYVIENDRKFGLLKGCEHVFCYECIREWRKQDTNTTSFESSSQSKEATKSCPVCRTPSPYILPSPFFANKEVKDLVDQNYKQKMMGTPCKYFLQCKTCPFGQNCFYSHGM